jgi:hypothetical protein
VLSITGDQVPLIPLVEVVGNAGNISPEQIEVIGLKVGVTFGVTVIVNVVFIAHCPAVGVKV